MLIYTITWVSNYKSNIDNYIKTEAEVVGHKNVSGQDRDVVSYLVDGVDYQVTADIKSRYDVGDIITIYYDNNNPMSFMYTDNRNVILPVICGSFGVICVALAVTYVVIFIGRKNEIKLQKQRVEEKSKKIKSRTQKKKISPNKQTSLSSKSINKNTNNKKKKSIK